MENEKRFHFLYHWTLVVITPHSSHLTAHTHTNTQIFTRQKSFRLPAFNNKMKKKFNRFSVEFELWVFYVNVHELQVHINKLGLVQQHTHISKSLFEAKMS